MKVVDVISTRVYTDSQQIIAQVSNLLVLSVPGLDCSAFINTLSFSVLIYNSINALYYRGIWLIASTSLSLAKLESTWKEAGYVWQESTSYYSHTVYTWIFFVWYLMVCMFYSFQTKKDQEEEEMEIATCSRGQYFGELALVTNKPRAASAYAVGSVKCLGTFCTILWQYIHCF